MKISKDRLKELVQEELAISFGGVAPAEQEMLRAPDAKVSSDGEGYMAKQNLWKIAEYANSLYELMSDEDCLEPWVEEKIAVASYIMDSVGHYIEYMKHRSHESAEGHMDTLEPTEMPEPVGMEEPEGMEPEEDEEYELDLDSPEAAGDDDEEIEFDFGDEDEEGGEEEEERR